MASTYRRVASNENNDDATGATTRFESNIPATTTRSSSERISDKVYALPWVIAAYIIAAYTRLFHTIYTDDRIIRSILVIAIILFSINAVLIMYLTVYLPYKFPISDKHKVSASSPAFWEVYCPKVIPTMTACGVVGSFLLVRACFPIWGFFSPALLGVVALGLFFSLHFIPWPF